MNYFNYFTEIETRFLERRGSILLLSTLDWALIETWREAGIPLELVLQGIDAAFDKHDAQQLRATRRVRKVNGLAWCAQAVLEAVEQSRDAAIGARAGDPPASPDSGFDPERITQFLHANAAILTSAAAPLPAASAQSLSEAAARLNELAASLAAPPTLSLEDLDRTLTVLEEKLLAALLTSTPEPELTALRAQADRELAPYRGKMQAVQIKQIHHQLLQKRLFETHHIPRLSLFYMPHI